MKIEERFTHVLECHDLGLFITKDLIEDLVIAAAKIDKVFDGKQRTSAAAAEALRMKEGRIAKAALKIMRALSQGVPLTDEDLVVKTNLSQNTVRPRRVALVYAGFIIDSGQRGITKSGNSAIQWTLTGAGRKALDQIVQHPL